MCGGDGGWGREQVWKLVPGAADLLEVGSSYSPALFLLLRGNCKVTEDSQGSGEHFEGHFSLQVDVHCGLVIKK